VLGLDVRGPTGGDSGAVADNLVFKAARALAERVEGLRLGRFVLSKRLPVAAGLGGGSADAAAALRHLARANKLAPNDPRVMDAARVTGADVPVCLDPRPRMMRGIGEVLSDPVALPPLAAVLVNPRVAVPTRDVFARLNARSAGPATRAHHDAIPDDHAGLLAYLRDHPNDLELPAVTLQPVIADVLAALRALAGCRLARMSGSGATCFGLFDSMRAATAAAKALRAARPAWWVRATTLG
jgi:4-diphosphocytidyl-2-C-methyl-D-erythritol kinase